MSTCISSRGEYGSHVLDDAYTCTWCGVLDEEALTAELRAMRPVVEAARAWRAEHQTWGTEGTGADLIAAVDALDGAS